MNYYPFILSKIKEITDKIPSGDFDNFINLIIKTPRVYIIGAGRSGLVARAFGMRLVHLKKKVFIVGETITPALRKGDTLIAVSGSGKTTWVVETAKASKALGGKVAAITWDSNSELARFADVVVQIPSEAMPREVSGYTTRELIGVPLPPLGSLFEISTLIFFEACVIELMTRLGIQEEEMRRIHANL
ncbi:MAG: 6-phospho-3-hexuloisomerase [Thermodesulfovibrionales bacterium]|nr:6-phospho-3-hexuloisomerase [Thermodesulfovibrionales bacterium]